MTRAINSTTLAWGLVSIPCKIYTAQKAESVSFNQITPAGNRTKQLLVDSVTGEEVERATLLKGYEHTKGEYVTFTEAEIKALETMDAAKTVSITEFVPAESVDHLWVEKSYYLGPDKGAAKGYALLAQVMLTKGVVAVAQWASRGKEHLVCIRATLQDGRYVLVFQQMYYANEVRPCDEIGVSGIEASEAERGMASQLIDLLSKFGFDADSYCDSFAQRVEAAVQQKLAGEDVTVAPVTVKPNVVDLTAALKASLDAA